MHKGEQWQVFLPNGMPLIGEGWDSAQGNPGDGDATIVGVTVVILYRKNAEGVLELLWQRRSEKVSAFPGRWDYAAGGHINLGETLTEAAVREAREEIGAEIAAGDLQLLEMIGYAKNRFGWVYMVDWAEREEAFHFDDEEVSEVKWVPYAETEEFVANYAKEPIQQDHITLRALARWLGARGLA